VHGKKLMEFDLILELFLFLLKGHDTGQRDGSSRGQQGEQAANSSAIDTYIVSSGYRMMFYREDSIS
jgi:hypothetical protein